MRSFLVSLWRGGEVLGTIQFRVQYNFVVSMNPQATSCIPTRAGRLDFGLINISSTVVYCPQNYNSQVWRKASKKDILHTRIFITLLPLYTMCSILQTK